MGMEEEIPRSSSAPLNNPPREPAPLDQEVNAGAGLAVPEPEPYSTGDSSCCPSTTADMGIISSPDLEVNAEAVLPQSGGGGGALTEAPVRASRKRKRLVRGSSSQRSTSEFDGVELMDALVQSDPSSADIKPPTGSTDLEIIDFLRSEARSMPVGKKVNLSVGEQDRMAPRAVRSYVTAVEMMPDQKTHLGYWKEKQADLLLDDKFGANYCYDGLKRTFQFHKYNGTKTNWFMHEYTALTYWGIDRFMESFRFREVYRSGEITGEPTSRERKINNNIAIAKKHRIRGYENLVIKGESPAWQHFIKIYDRHPELDWSKVVYAVCRHCKGVLRGGTENGTKSLLNHCYRTCPVKNKTKQPRVCSSDGISRLMRLDESAGHIPPDPQSAGHISPDPRSVKDILSVENPPREPAPLVVNTGPGLPQSTGPSFDLPPAPSSPPPLPPSLVPCSQWEKGECIGCGSFGQVYRGFNSEHGQFCAIKEVLVILNDPRSEEQLKQLNQEIYLLKQLSHPNIVQYYGSIMTDKALSIYMEYVSKGSIHVLLAKDGPFKESRIRSYTAQILSGLVFLHKRRLIHRDIKGANILVGPNDEVKIADFGLAKHIRTLTAVHTSKRGTGWWMAPEVFLSTYSDEGYNLSADIYSLGCTVIEMATGKPPLHDLEEAQVMFKIAFDSEYKPEILDKLSNEGKDFLQQCLQHDRKRRPSAAALLDHPFIRNQG